MSRIYAGGVEATAKANILADIEDYISFDENGVLGVDTEGLTTYLRDEFDSLPAEAVAPADATSVTAATAAISVGGFVADLNNTLRVENFQTRLDWPITTSVLAGGTHVAAVAKAFAECEALSDKITYYYRDLSIELPGIITTRFYEMNLEASLPPTVTRIEETRAYIHTYVTDWDEESVPSPASALLDLDQNDTVTVTQAATVPSGRNIDRWRIYRANQGSETADYQLVVELPIGTTTYTDEVPAALLEETCPTTTWEPPPATLRSLTRMPNNFLVGGDGFMLCCSEPNHYYAWPPEYQKPLGAPFVACASAGSLLVVGTWGKPKLYTGADPASLTEIDIDSNQACISARSMVAVAGGVVYASPDGLCLATPSGVEVITKPHFNKADWNALNPETLIAVECEGNYLAFCDTGTEQGAFMLDPATGKLTMLSTTASAVFPNLISDTVYYAQGTAIKALFASATPREAIWQSARNVFPAVEGFAWLQVWSFFEAGPVTVNLLGDGVTYYTVEVSSTEPVRVPSGEYTEHEVSIGSQSIVTEVNLASSIDELMEK